MKPVTPDEIAREIADVSTKKKSTRAKPHRCHECGRVSRYVFCPACLAERYPTKADDR